MKTPLRSFDLNLLVCFDALMRERHVSRAAVRLGISQPAMSSALSRLRDLFNDPLLVRTPSGLVPTERALDLAKPISHALVEIESSLHAPAVFDPAVARFTFRLIGSDLIELLVLQPLLKLLSRSAPGIRVHYLPPNPLNFAGMMARGELELAIGWIQKPNERLHVREFASDRFVCIARRDHPTVAGRIALNDYIGLAHAQVLPRDSEMYATPIDRALSELGAVRQIAAWTPGFLALAELVSGTDLISTVPELFANHPSVAPRVQIVPVPIGLEPITFRMFWHERSHKEAQHKWMRERIIEIARGIGAARIGEADSAA